LALESLFWFYDNAGVRMGKILSLNKTNRNYCLLGDIVTISPRHYKLNKKHLKKKRTLFSAVICGLTK